MTIAFKTARVISSYDKRIVALALVTIVDSLSGTTYLYVELSYIIVTIIVPSSSKSMKL